MNISYRFIAPTLALVLACAPASVSAEPEASPASTAAPACELHVYPTRNFVALSTGMLSGFALVGGLADMAIHKNKTKTVQETMEDILTPEVQMEQLRAVDFVHVLKLPADTVVKAETPFPSAVTLKANPELKAQIQTVEADIKAGKRVTASSAPCYAELFVAQVFYQKAAMYGTRVFTSFVYRDFHGGSGAPKVSRGQVETHTPDFPAAAPDKDDIAKAALLHAYGADFVKWAELKLKVS